MNDLIVCSGSYKTLKKGGVYRYLLQGYDKYCIRCDDGVTRWLLKSGFKKFKPIYYV